MPVLNLPAEHATDVRPARSVAARKDWAKDPSSPTAQDGTRLDATFANDLLGLIRYLLTASGVGQTPGQDSCLADAVVAIVGTTAPAAHMHDDRYFTEAEANAAFAALAHTHAVQALTDGAGYVRMTDAERAKLAALVTNYKGSYATLAAVAAAYPSAAAGDWAVISLAGESASIAVWDADAAPAAWVDIDNAPSQTAATLSFSPHGSIAATNVQAALQEVRDEAVPTSRQVVSGAGFTGGGDLSADRTLAVGAGVGVIVNADDVAVDKATADDLRTGTNNKVVTTDIALSAMSWVALTDAANIDVAHNGGPNRTVTLAGNRTFNNPTLTKIGFPLNIAIKQDATGSRTAAWGANYDFGQDTAPVLSTAANAEDLVCFVCRSATKYVYLGIRKGVE